MSITDAISRLAYGLCNMSSWTSSNDADCVSIAAAFSDPAPIDEAWLREWGFVVKDGARELTGADGFPRAIVEWDAPDCVAVWAYDETGRKVRSVNPTRGRFRALLHGLGMEVQG